MSKYATKEQLISIVQDMASKISVPTIGIGGGYAPIGTIISYMGVTAPQDYLACDGSTYNISAYPDLADFIESQFGSKNKFGGDGTTTFAVPDLRGEFLRGTGTNSHTDQGDGANVGTHQDGSQHIYMYVNGDNSLGLFGNDTDFLPTNRDKTVQGATKWANFTKSGTGAIGGGRYYTSRPTNTSILWCIKAVAVGYSTDEHVVSKWIDGKDVYEKTIELTMPTTTSQKSGAYYSATTSLDVTALGIEQLVSLNAVHSGGSIVNVNQYFGYSSDVEATQYEGLNTIQCWFSMPGTISLRRYSAKSVNTDAGAKVYVTIQYTKTT